MIRSLFTNTDYNLKGSLKFQRFKKLRDVKNGSEYIGGKGNPVYNDIKRRRIFKNQNNFLTFKLSTVQFEAPLLVSVNCLH